MITLTTPPARAVSMRRKTDEQLRALAASGYASLTRDAKAEIKRRRTAELEQEMGR